MGQEEVDAVLAGEASYDDLDPQDQAVVRAEWERRTAERRASLDYEAEFTAAGEAWSEADDDANLVIQIPDAVLGRVEASRAAGPARTGRPVRRAHMDAARDEEWDGTTDG